MTNANPVGIQTVAYVSLTVIKLWLYVNTYLSANFTYVCCEAQWVIIYT